MIRPDYLTALRDSFAQAAMSEILRASISNEELMDCNEMERIASVSWSMADAMLSEREFITNFSSDDDDDDEPDAPHCPEPSEN